MEKHSKKQKEIGKLIKKAQELDLEMRQLDKERWTKVNEIDVVYQPKMKAIHKKITQINEKINKLALLLEHDTDDEELALGRSVFREPGNLDVNPTLIADMQRVRKEMGFDPVSRSKIITFPDCHACTGGCETTCTGGCDGTCKGTCGGSCKASGGGQTPCRVCYGTCEGSCIGTCEGACGSGCWGTCSGGHYGGA